MTTLVAGVPVRGSWWGHPQGRAIYAALVELSDSGVATSAKLVGGKVTWVHERLWPALHRIGSARADWQLAKLSRAASTLLDEVEERGELSLAGSAGRISGRRAPELAAARELEARLLVHAGEEHTHTGAHARVLTSWKRWAASRELRVSREPLVRARRRFEEIVDAWAALGGVRGRLPWEG